MLSKGRTGAAIGLITAALAAAGCSSHTGGHGTADFPSGSSTAGSVASSAGSAPSSPGAPPAPSHWQLGPTEIPAQEFPVASWLVDANVVVVTNRTVTAYDQATGKQQWSTKPLGSSLFCGASRHPGKTVAALGLGVDTGNGTADCAGVTAINVHTGHLAQWAKRVGPDHAQPGKGRTAHVLADVVGSTVVVGWSNVIAGYRVTDGKRLYKNTITNPEDKQPCEVEDVAASADTALAISGCQYSMNGNITLGQLNPTTGRLLHQAIITDAVAGIPLHDYFQNSILSGSPPTVLISTIFKPSSVISFDSAMHKRSAITFAWTGKIGGDNAVSPSNQSDSGPSLESYHLTIADDTLYAVSGQIDKAKDFTVVAYSLASGAKRWSSRVPGNPVQLAGGPNGRLTVMGTSVNSAITTSKVRLSTVDADTGQVAKSVLTDLPETSGADLSYYALFATSDKALGVYSGDTPRSAKVMLFAY